MPEHKSADEIERVFKVRQLPKNLSNTLPKISSRVTSR